MPQGFGQYDQRGISQVHGQIGILAHQFRDAWQMLVLNGEELSGAVAQALDKCPLGMLANAA